MHPTSVSSADDSPSLIPDIPVLSDSLFLESMNGGPSLVRHAVDPFHSSPTQQETAHHQLSHGSRGETQDALSALSHGQDGASDSRSPSDVTPPADTTLSFDRLRKGFDSILASATTQLQRRLVVLQRFESRLRQREEAVSQREQSLETKAKQLVAVSTAFTQHRQGLLSREASLKQQVTQKAQELSHRESLLNAREAQLREKATELEKVKQRLTRFEAKLTSHVKREWNQVTRLRSDLRAQHAEIETVRSKQARNERVLEFREKELAELKEELHVGREALDKQREAVRVFRRRDGSDVRNPNSSHPRSTHSRGTNVTERNRVDETGMDTLLRGLAESAGLTTNVDDHRHPPPSSECVEEEISGVVGVFDWNLPELTIQDL